MEQQIFEIRSHTRLTDRVWRLELAGNTRAITAPGQFVELQIPGKFLRRPISVCDYAPDSLTLVYKVVGSGTEILSGMKPGNHLDVLTGLGNGYDLSLSGDKPVLVGGGVGVPPLYALAKALLAAGKRPQAVLGFNTAQEIFLADSFRALGIPVCLTTADGSEGIRGFVTDALQALDYSYFYACGPAPMLRAMASTVRTAGQYSLEERMGCGFGACMGCSIPTKNGMKRVCKDGPVFSSEEVLL